MHRWPGASFRWPVRVGGICPAARCGGGLVPWRIWGRKSAETNVCVILPCFPAFPAAAGAGRDMSWTRAGGIER